MDNISVTNTKFRGAGLIAVVFLLFAIFTTYTSLVGLVLSGNLVWPIFLLPLFFLIGSIGLFARRKWSLLFIIPALVFLYWRIVGVGFLKEVIDPNIIISDKILILLPLILLFYIVFNYKKLK